MSEPSGGLRALEMHERQEFYRQRAVREGAGLALDRRRRRVFRSRADRPSA